MTVVLMVIAVLVIAAAIGMIAWQSSARKFPSDETLRHPRPNASEPLIREQSRHRDTPAAADLDKPGGREHGL